MNAFNNMNPDELNQRVAGGHMPSHAELKAACERNTKGELWQNRELSAEQLIRAGMTFTGIGLTPPCVMRSHLMSLPDGVIHQLLMMAGCRLIEMGTYKLDHPDAGSTHPDDEVAR